MTTSKEKLYVLDFCMHFGCSFGFLVFFIGINSPWAENQFAAALFYLRSSFFRETGCLSSAPILTTTHLLPQE